MCSKYENHSKLDWGDLYDHLMSTKIFTFMMNMIFIQVLKIMRQMAMGMVLELLIILH